LVAEPDPIILAIKGAEANEHARKSALGRAPGSPSRDSVVRFTSTSAATCSTSTTPSDAGCYPKP